MRRTWLVVVLAGALWLAGCGDDAETQPTPTPTPSTSSASPGAPGSSPTAPAGFADPADAIAAYLKANGLQYAGVCQEQPPSSDIGKYCSTVADDRGDEVVVKVGLIQSEYDTYLLLRRTDGSWLVVDSAEFPVPDDGTLPF